MQGLVSDMEDLCTKPVQPTGFPEALKAYMKVPSSNIHPRQCITRVDVGQRLSTDSCHD